MMLGIIDILLINQVLIKLSISEESWNPVAAYSPVMGDVL